jgi:hypothetical protein
LEGRKQANFGKLYIIRHGEHCTDAVVDVQAMWHYESKPMSEEFHKYNT